MQAIILFAVIAISFVVLLFTSRSDKVSNNTTESENNNDSTAMKKSTVLSRIGEFLSSGFTKLLMGVAIIWGILIVVGGFAGSIAYIATFIWDFVSAILSIFSLIGGWIGNLFS